MNIFEFGIKMFEKKPTTIEAIETWIVEWKSIYHDIGRFYLMKPNFLTFTSKYKAQEYAKELQDARKLLGDTDLCVRVYKQEVPTNV